MLRGKSWRSCSRHLHTGLLQAVSPADSEAGYSGHVGGCCREECGGAYRGSAVRLVRRTGSPQGHLRVAPDCCEASPIITQQPLWTIGMVSKIFKAPNGSRRLTSVKEAPTAAQKSWLARCLERISPAMRSRSVHSRAKLNQTRCPFRHPGRKPLSLLQKTRRPGA